jgi:hypothetical protein
MQRLTLFQNTNEPSPPLDPAFLAFSIPSAENLYLENIFRDKYELISQLSLDAIKKILSDKGCDIADFAKDPEIKMLSETHYHYIFSFNDVNDFAAREKLIIGLHELRYAEVNKKNLFLDTGTIRLHLSNAESYEFDAEQKQSIFSNAYRALCIYDLIVEELYRHNLKRTDDDYTNSLISDYLSVHGEDFTGFKTWNTHFEVCKKLQKCLKDIICDRGAAAVLNDSFNETVYIDDETFKRGVLGSMPLTRAAQLREKPVNTYCGKLNQYSRHYCSLIQYRYLMDLKCLFSLVDENELQKIKDHMARWENFKRQPVIVKYESLVNKIENFQRENREGVGKSSCDSWESCYWQERTQNGEEVVFIRVFNPHVKDRLLNREFTMELQRYLQPVLNTTRCNTFQSGDARYQEGYHLLVKQQDLAKCSLENLDNLVLEKINVKQSSVF